MTRFALGTFALDGAEPFAGLVLGDRVAKLAGTTVRALIEDWDRALPELQALADSSPDTEHELAALRPLPPVHPSGQLFQAGANYRAHVLEIAYARELREKGELSDDDRRGIEERVDERARMGRPYVFLGLPHSVVGAFDDVILPAAGEQHDWELELAAVIGRTARTISREDALGVIAGYTICNDLTTRDRVHRPDLPAIGTDWLASKNAPTFSPTGPLLVPAAHAGNPMDLRITLRLNGEVMQDASTDDMIFDIASLIEYVSSIAELRPGDLLLTGSPAGNGVAHGRFLRPGDVLEGEITGLGRQRNRCVAA